MPLLSVCCHRLSTRSSPTRIWATLFHLQLHIQTKVIISSRRLTLYTHYIPTIKLLFMKILKCNIWKRVIHFARRGFGFSSFIPGDHKYKVVKFPYGLNLFEGLLNFSSPGSFYFLFYMSGLHKNSLSTPWGREQLCIHPTPKILPLCGVQCVRLVIDIYGTWCIKMHV